MKSAMCLAAFLTLATSGCALTSKADALTVRWFEPVSTQAHLTSAGRDASVKANGIEVDLGRVGSGVALRDKIAYRDDAFEVGFYDDRRWTERPEVFVRRAIARNLYEEHGMSRALGGNAPVLDVDLVAFEEVRGARPGARIRLRVILHDDRRTFVEKTLTVEKPIAPGAKGFDGVVLAMSEALDAVVEDIAREVVAAAPAAKPSARPTE